MEVTLRQHPKLHQLWIVATQKTKIARRQEAPDAGSLPSIHARLTMGAQPLWIPLGRKVTSSLPTPQQADQAQKAAGEANGRSATWVDWVQAFMDTYEQL